MKKMSKVVKLKVALMTQDQAIKYLINNGYCVTTSSASRVWYLLTHKGLGCGE